MRRVREPERKTRVFIADDHVLSRECVETCLNQTGRYEVVGQCGDGLQAVEQIVATHPDVVVLNIQMPSLNGIDVCREVIRQKSAWRILMYTMHDEEECILRAFAAGAKGYVVKDST